MVSISTGKGSKQDYCTPRDFLDAVEKHFGEIRWDLAASDDNAVCLNYFTKEIDALIHSWDRLASELPHESILWLNPPFADIAPWARLCASFKGSNGCRIAFLVPASVGSNWFSESVWSYADVYFLKGRLSFDGVSPFPKDCVLAIFPSSYSHAPPVRQIWDWRARELT